MRDWRKRAWLAAALLCVAPVAGAQQQKPAEEKKEQESLAEAARRLRGQRQGTSPSGKVWTNDNLPSSRGGVTTADSADSGAAPSGGGDVSRATNEAEEAERAEAEKAVKEEKARLEQLKGDLNLLERDLDLTRQQLSSNPRFADDTAGQRRISDMQAQVDAKKSEIATAEAKVAEVEQALAEINERLGPKTLTPEEQRAQRAEQLRPLQDELAQVERELSSLRAQLPRSPGISPGAGNDHTRDRISALEARRAELQRKISDLQDEARRAGPPPA